jgi:uncharacterized protein YkwD
MRRRFIRVSIILLTIVVGAQIFLFTGTTLRSGSNPITGEPEQTSGVIPVSTHDFTLSPVTMNTSPKPTTLPTPPLTVATGSGAVYPYPISMTALEQRVHELINQQRTGKGLSALSIDSALADIARKHSEDMAGQHYFAHENPAGQNPTARGNAAGYSCRKNYGSYSVYGIAENIFLNNLYSSATYYSNRETVYHWNTPEVIAQITVAGWMNSSGHRENILTPTFEHEGIGVAIASEKVYITENFC